MSDVSKLSFESQLSICKSKAWYNETAEKTAEMHSCSVDDVKTVWDQNPKLIQDYQEAYAELIGCDEKSFSEMEVL